MSQYIKDVIHATRDRVIEDPEAGKITFRSSTQLQDGFRSEASIRQHQIVVDEPPALGGGDKGPNPVELILAALGTCQEITYRAFASALDIPLDSVRVELEGDLDLRGFLAICPNARPGFKAIRGTVHIVSTAPQKDLDRLRRAVNEHCPVLDIVQKPVPVALDVSFTAPDAVADAQKAA